jgi:hypothetical protein
MKKSKEKGTSILEFVLVAALVMVPLLLGTLVVGFNLVRLLQVNQLNRDAGHMFARGVDFSATTGAGNRAILVQLSPRLSNSSNQGTGAVILSSVEFIGPNTCTNCANLNHAVFTKQVVIGNSGLRSSVLGAVPTASFATDGSGNVKNPLNDTAVRADGIANLIPSLDGNPSLDDGQMAFVAETCFTSADFDIQHFLTPSQVYSRGIF